MERDWTVRPGATLADWIEENGLSVRSTATICRRMDPQRLQRIIDGKQRITKADAEALHAGTQIPSSLWLALERTYRADLRAGRKDVG
jgi:plasmid maintenance system antidote protein VapI